MEGLDISAIAREDNDRARRSQQRGRVLAGVLVGGMGAIAGGTALVLNADSLYLGPDAQEIALDEATDFSETLEKNCGVGLKTPLTRRSLSADSSLISATVRYTLDAQTPEQEACVRSTIDGLTPAYDRFCSVGISYPRGWREADGGMRMSVVADCSPAVE